MFTFEFFNSLNLISKTSVLLFFVYFIISSESSASNTRIFFLAGGKKDFFVKRSRFIIFFKKTNILKAEFCVNFIIFCSRIYQKKFSNHYKFFF